MRKYIHIARCMKPKLTEEASAVIAEEYSKLRSEDVVESDVARVGRNLVSISNVQKMSITSWSCKQYEVYICSINLLLTKCDFV